MQEKVKASAVVDGTQEFQLAHWKDFYEVIERSLFAETDADLFNFVWRGQRDSSWSLIPTLDRLLRRLDPHRLYEQDYEAISANHLQAFKLATRGRRGQNPANLEEVEWWALGQHFGLATPLLDWTHSPYAAEYFAFEELAPSESRQRAVYGLDVDLIEKRSRAVAEGLSLESGRVPWIQVLDSLSNENPRLVSQGGLFTRAPIGTSIETWVENEFEGYSRPVLFKILIPDENREDRTSCLQGLDRMNINHASLFPDLVGASRATNLKLEIYPLNGEA